MPTKSKRVNEIERLSVYMALHRIFCNLFMLSLSSFWCSLVTLVAPRSWFWIYGMCFFFLFSFFCCIFGARILFFFLTIIPIRSFVALVFSLSQRITRSNSALCQLGVDSISDKINCIHNQIYHIFFFFLGSSVNVTHNSQTTNAWAAAQRPTNPNGSTKK